MRHHGHHARPIFRVAWSSVLLTVLPAATSCMKASTSSRVIDATGLRPSRGMMCLSIRPRSEISVDSFLAAFLRVSTRPASTSARYWRHSSRDGDRLPTGHLLALWITTSGDIAKNSACLLPRRVRRPWRSMLADGERPFATVGGAVAQIIGDDRRSLPTSRKAGHRTVPDRLPRLKRSDVPKGDLVLRASRHSAKAPVGRHRRDRGEWQLVMGSMSGWLPQFQGGT